jgi:hypothetical protein
MYSQVSGIMSKKIIKAGDSVVLFFIKRSERSNYYLNRGVKTLISNEGSEVLYTPVSLPICGVFNECNFLVDIEENENVSDIESKLGMSIKDILSCIGDEREIVKIKNEETKKIISKLSICLEHENVFDKMVTLDKEKRSFDESSLYKESIEKLNFVTTETVSGRYCYKMENDFIPDIIIYKDKSDFAQVEKNGKIISGIYTLKDLINLTKLSDEKFKGETTISLHINNVDLKRTNVIYKVHSEKEEEIKEKLTTFFMSSPDMSLKENVDKMNLLLEEGSKENEGSNISHLTSEELEINNRNIESINSYEKHAKLLNTKSIFDLDRDSVENLFHFMYSMWATSSLFMPTYSGYNDTEDNYEKELHSILSKLF